MPTQYLAGKCGHCHNGILKMVRPTLKVDKDRVTASYECINPLCNNITMMVLYDINRQEWLEEWQRDISDQYSPPAEVTSYYPL